MAKQVPTKGNANVVAQRHQPIVRKVRVRVRDRVESSRVDNPSAPKDWQPMAKSLGTARICSSRCSCAAAVYDARSAAIFTPVLRHPNPHAVNCRAPFLVYQYAASSLSAASKGPNPSLPTAMGPVRAPTPTTAMLIPPSRRGHAASRNIPAAGSPHRLGRSNQARSGRRHR